MTQGRIDKIISDRGFMFIRNENSGKTTFAHITQCVSRFDDMRVGDLVEYEIARTERGKPEARGVTLVPEP